MSAERPLHMLLCVYYYILERGRWGRGPDLDIKQKMLLTALGNELGSEPNLSWEVVMTTA